MYMRIHFRNALKHSLVVRHWCFLHVHFISTSTTAIHNICISVVADSRLIALHSYFSQLRYQANVLPSMQYWYKIQKSIF